MSDFYNICDKCRQVTAPGAKLRCAGRKLYHEECYRKLVRKAQRQGKAYAYASLGLKRVRGALGGAGSPATASRSKPD